MHSIGHQKQHGYHIRLLSDDSTPLARQSNRYSLSAQDSLTPRPPSATIPFSARMPCEGPWRADTLDATRLYHCLQLSVCLQCNTDCTKCQYIYIVCSAKLSGPESPGRMITVNLGLRFAPDPRWSHLRCVEWASTPHGSPAQCSWKYYRSDQTPGT